MYKCKQVCVGSPVPSSSAESAGSLELACNTSEKEKEVKTDPLPFETLSFLHIAINHRPRREFIDTRYFDSICSYRGAQISAHWKSLQRRPRNKRFHPTWMTFCLYYYFYQVCWCKFDVKKKKKKAQICFRWDILIFLQLKLKQNPTDLSDLHVIILDNTIKLCRRQRTRRRGTTTRRRRRRRRRFDN